MKTPEKVIIIGGGIIGLSCAHYLMKKGAQVVILEEKQVGTGASHGNCGLLYFTDLIPLCSPGTVTQELIKTLKRTSPLHIKPRPDVGLMSWLFKFAAHCRPSHMSRAARDKTKILAYSSDLFDRLMADEHLSCDQVHNGVLVVFKDEKNLASYQKTNAFLNRFGIAYTRLNRAETLEREPALRQDIAGAWHNPDDWHLRPEHLVRAWRDNLIDKGLSIEENCPVKGFRLIAGSIAGLETPRGVVKGQAYVLATGAWAPLTVRQLGLNLPVQPGKGYSITMPRPSICPAHPCVLYEKKMVVTPWKSGCRLGGTMEFSGYNTQLTPKRLGKLVQGANAYLRTPLGRPPHEEWTGLRPMTFDDMPIIDRAPGRDNLFIATGHGMLGLTLATGTGRIIADMVYGKTPQIDITPYALSRF